METQNLKHKQEYKIYKKAKKIIASNLEWSEKFDMIFSKEIAAKFNLDYYDPDRSYEEDVMAFMDALDKHMKNKTIIKKTAIEGNYYWVRKSLDKEFEPAKCKDYYHNGNLYFCFTNGSIMKVVRAFEFELLKYR